MRAPEPLERSLPAAVDEVGVHLGEIVVVHRVDDQHARRAARASGSSSSARRLRSAARRSPRSEPVSGFVARSSAIASAAAITSSTFDG